MGFLSGIIGGKKTKAPASGFYSMPGEYQSAYTGVLNNIKSGLPNINADMFTPMEQTAGETQAYDAINQGFTPDQNQLNSDIQMQMNPWDTSVLDTINRQAGGEYSILKQALGEAGQFGSNRQNLGANDIDLSRLQQIGTFKQGQYNNAIQNALSVLPGLRANDASMQLGAGDAQRGLDSQTKMAPLNALTAQSSLVGSVPTQFGEFGSPQTTVKTGGGLGELLNAAQTAGRIYTAFSDIRMKKDIKFIGVENGHNIYEFRYLDQPEKYIGVMAHEVEKTHNDAVTEIDGYKAVDYAKIGVEMRRVA